MGSIPLWFVILPGKPNRILQHELQRPGSDTCHFTPCSSHLSVRVESGWPWGPGVVAGEVAVRAHACRAARAGAAREADPPRLPLIGRSGPGGGLSAAPRAPLLWLGSRWPGSERFPGWRGSAGRGPVRARRAARDEAAATGAGTGGGKRRARVQSWVLRRLLRRRGEPLERGGGQRSAGSGRPRGGLPVGIPSPVCSHAGGQVADRVALPDLAPSHWVLGSSFPPTTG